MIPDEMIVTDWYYICFLRTAPDGVTEVVDRHHADVVEIVRRLPDGRDGERTRVPVNEIK